MPTIAELLAAKNASEIAELALARAREHFSEYADVLPEASKKPLPDKKKSESWLQETGPHGAQNALLWAQTVSIEIYNFNRQAIKENAFSYCQQKEIQLKGAWAAPLGTHQRVLVYLRERCTNFPDLVKKLPADCSDSAYQTLVKRADRLLEQKMGMRNL